MRLAPWAFGEQIKKFWFWKFYFMKKFSGLLCSLSLSFARLLLLGSLFFHYVFSVDVHEMVCVCVCWKVFFFSSLRRSFLHFIYVVLLVSNFSSTFSCFLFSNLHEAGRCTHQHNLIESARFCKLSAAHTHTHTHSRARRRNIFAWKIFCT